MTKKKAAVSRKRAKAKAPSRKAGRPSKYMLDLAESICERLSSGESLTRICSTEGMPKRTTVVGWQGQHDGFSTLYARARRAYADAIFDEAMEIADDSSGDWTTKVVRGEEVRAVDHENIQRSRLRVDTRLRVAAKINPAKYGEKLDLNMSGELNVCHLSDAKLNARIIGLLEKIGISGELATPFLLKPLPGDEEDDETTRH